MLGAPSCSGIPSKALRVHIEVFDVGSLTGLDWLLLVLWILGAFIVIGIFALIYLVALNLNFIGTIAPVEYLGEVKDFEVSAGGFGSPTTCTILTTDDEKSVLTQICLDLRTGSKIYRHAKHGWFGDAWIDYSIR